MGVRTYAKCIFDTLDQVTTCALHLTVKRLISVKTLKVGFLDYQQIMYVVRLH